MRMNWDRLRVLDAVARTGSVGEAAVVLHLTGPAISQQLRRIEAEAGVSIVVPAGRGIRLTDEGKLLADYARRMRGLMQSAENELHRGGTLTGEVRVAAIASVIRTVLSARLPIFEEEYPRVRVTVEDGETSAHVASLVAGRVDVVLAESWSTAPTSLPASVQVRRLSREAVTISLPASHRLAARGSIEPRELAGERWATCAAGSDAHRAIDQEMRRHGVDIDVRHFVADHATQIALVHAGLAIACVPRTGESRAHDGVVERPLAVEMTRDVLLVTRAGTASLVVQSLAERLLSHE
ncbi:LysR family transcriptional regulator [Demequina aestuarii]|uniref:LysR family transcriptional regulator n=1 Tax=Demequina aestuarii TaxID=327095 RepID=UPI000785FF4A|nr:LysR family transcriptional regulator [Demequina aestuarii]